jgi:hypothetical protein
VEDRLGWGTLLFLFLCSPIIKLIGEDVRGEIDEELVGKDREIKEGKKGEIIREKGEGVWYHLHALRTYAMCEDTRNLQGSAISQWTTPYPISTFYIMWRREERNIRLNHTFSLSVNQS